MPSARDQDILAGASPDRAPWRPPRALLLLFAVAALAAGVGYVITRGPEPVHPVYGTPTQPPAYRVTAAVTGRLVAAAGWQYIRYDLAAPTVIGNGYLRFDAASAAPLGTARGVTDVLVTPELTALLFRDRVKVVRQVDHMSWVLGPAEFVLPTYDRQAVLMVGDRGSASGETVARLDLRGHPIGRAFRAPPRAHVVAEASDERLVLSESDGALTLWEPRSRESQPLAKHAVLDSIVGGQAVTRDQCEGTACRYTVTSLDGRRSTVIALPRPAKMLGAPVLSPDGVHFAVVADVSAGLRPRMVEFGVGTIKSAGADVRFVGELPYGRDDQPGGVRPVWSPDGATVYAPRPVTGEVVAYRVGAVRPEITPYHLSGVSRIWL